MGVEDVAFRNGTYLYSTLKNYVNILADENGLWVIYSSKRSNNTMVLKVKKLMDVRRGGGGVPRADYFSEILDLYSNRTRYENKLK